MVSRAISSLDDLISVYQSAPPAGWNSANTDGRTPAFANALDKAWEDLDFVTRDTLYFKFDAEVIQTGMYALEFYHKVGFTLELICPILNNLTYGARPHFQKMVEETSRVIEVNPRRANYAYTLYDAVRVRYNKDKGVYLGTFDGELERVS